MIGTELRFGDLKMRENKAFTLIELLIVVAIIAILAAIAVPNFLEAQTRAKVSRVKADMRSIATGLESYQIDNNSYVYQNSTSRAIALPPVNTPTLERLTTPIAYMNAITFRTPFKTTKMANDAKLRNPNNIADPNLENAQFYWYSARNNAGGPRPTEGAAIWRNPPDKDPKPQWYFTHSSGPAGVCFQPNGALNAMTTSNDNNKDTALGVIYEATNGTVSYGAIWRVGGSSTPLAKDFYDALQGAN